MLKIDIKWKYFLPAQQAILPSETENKNRWQEGYDKSEGTNNQEIHTSVYRSDDIDTKQCCSKESFVVPDFIQPAFVFFSVLSDGALHFRYICKFCRSDT